MTINTTHEYAKRMKNEFHKQLDVLLTDMQPKTEDAHRQQHNVPNTGFPILPSDPPPSTLLCIEPFNCPKEEGEGRYESTYLLGLCAGHCLVCARAGVAHQLTRILAVVSTRILATAQASNICGRSYSRCYCGCQISNNRAWCIS